MSKHTPGPWSIEQFCHPYRETGDVTVTSYTKTHHNPLRIGRAYNIIGRDETMSNARLIAAAPDMLEAIKKMLTQFADHAQYDDEGFDTSAIESAIAAVAKAERGTP